MDKDEGFGLMDFFPGFSLGGGGGGGGGLDMLPGFGIESGGGGSVADAVDDAATLTGTTGGGVTVQEETGDFITARGNALCATAKQLTGRACTRDGDFVNVPWLSGRVQKVAVRDGASCKHKNGQTYGHTTAATDYPCHDGYFGTKVRFCDNGTWRTLNGDGCLKESNYHLIDGKRHEKAKVCVVGERVYNIGDPLMKQCSGSTPVGTWQQRCDGGNQWSDELKTCRAESVPEPEPEVRYCAAVAPWVKTKAGMRASLSCTALDPDKWSSGNASRECGDTGQWRAVVTAACRAPPPPPPTRCSGPDAAVGAERTEACGTGMTGNRVFKCSTAGDWQAIRNACIAVASAPDPTVPPPAVETVPEQPAAPVIVENEVEQPPASVATAQPAAPTDADGPQTAAPAAASSAAALGKQQEVGGEEEPAEPGIELGTILVIGGAAVGVLLLFKAIS